MSRRRKHCSAQPYLDYIGVSEKERKEWNKEEELRSKCCGAEVKELPKNTLFFWGYPVNQYCSNCHKPAKVEEKDHDEEWKNARDAYSGKREEE